VSKPTSSLPSRQVPDAFCAPSGDCAICDKFRAETEVSSFEPAWQERAAWVN
jgi:hypothetical protein